MYFFKKMTSYVFEQSHKNNLHIFWLYNSLVFSSFYLNFKLKYLEFDLSIYDMMI